MNLTVQLVAGALHLEADGKVTVLSADRLRAACRCATCRAAGRTQGPIAVADGLAIAEVREIGAYAAQLVFSDGHDRGIYPLPYLTELADKVACEAPATSR